MANKKKLVIGVIGADVHAVGNTILNRAFLDAGFDVTNLGVLVPQEEFIQAAVEVGADAIVVSSLYGQGEIDCTGMRQKCDEAGLKGILLYAGGKRLLPADSYLFRSSKKLWQLYINRRLTINKIHIAAAPIKNGSISLLVPLF